MSKSSLRIAVVGARNIGRNHARILSALPDVEVVAVADTDLPRAKAVAEEFGARETYADAAELVERSDAEGVVLAVPNHLHAPLAIRAMEAGKHVLVEKPIARTADEAREIIEARDRTGRRLVVGMNQRFHPDRMALKEKLDAGVIGDIRYGKTAWLRRNLGKGVWARGEWFLTPERSGGGAVIDLGVHRLDLALHMMGFPKPVSVHGETFSGIGRAEAAKEGKVYECEDCGVALIRFEDGKALFLEASYFLNCREENAQATRLYGERGGAEILEEAALYTIEDGELVEQPLGEPASATRSVGEHFCNVIRGREEVIPTAEQALEAMRIMEALYESARTGEAVPL